MLTAEGTLMWLTQNSVIYPHKTRYTYSVETSAYRESRLLYNDLKIECCKIIYPDMNTQIVTGVSYLMCLLLSPM